MRKPTANVSAEAIGYYDRLLASFPEVERKGASMPYTSLNGHMFSFLTPEGKLALRLPAGEREAFLERYATKVCEQHGSVLKEYVEVPDSLFTQTAELEPYFAASVAYVGTLKPKPTKVKKTG